MRAFPVLALCAFVLAACGCSCPPPTVVVPSGASVVCPNGAPAVNSGNGYRC
jgi:hypothetical protein